MIAGSEREIWEVTVEVQGVDGAAVRETINTTDDHPFRTADGRWTNAADLSPGGGVVTAQGLATVVSVVKSDRIKPTYNFEVEGYHTYFVGSAGVWVHNAKCGLLWKLGDSASKSLARMQRQMAQRGWTGRQITEAVKGGRKFSAPNKLNPANGATRYVHPTTGQSVVIDDVTGQVIHVGGPGYVY